MAAAATLLAGCDKNYSLEQAHCTFDQSTMSARVIDTRTQSPIVAVTDLKITAPGIFHGFPVLPAGSEFSLNRDAGQNHFTVNLNSETCKIRNMGEFGSSYFGLRNNAPAP